MPKDRASQSICPYGSQRNTICSTLDIRLVSIATIALLVLVGCATSGEHADSAAGGDDNLDPAVLNDTLGSGEQAAASLLNRQLEAIPRRELVVFTIQGKVKSVQDGDSLRITSDAGTTFSIRMSDIDTPEAFHPARPDNRCKCRVPKDRPGSRSPTRQRNPCGSLHLRIPRSAPSGTRSASTEGRYVTFSLGR